MKSVIIIGGGTSVREGIEKGLWDKIRGQTIISLNSVYKMMPYTPTIEMWVDKHFFMHDMHEIQKLYEKGVKLVAREQFNLKAFADKVELFQTSREHQNYFGKKALEKNMLYYGRMGLSGAFALAYSIAHSYDTIYLLGYDFGSIADNKNFTHWYQDSLRVKDIYSTGAGHPEIYLKKSALGTETNAFMEDFKHYSQEEGIEIFNVSLQSNLPYFKKINYDEFFGRIKDARPEENQTNVKAN